MHDGFYTVVTGEKHFTYRVFTQDASASFAPGKQIIGFLRGTDNTQDYVNFAFVDGSVLRIWKKYARGKFNVIEQAKFLVGDRDGQTIAGKQYAIQSGNCYICNRLLTTPESIEAGIGPVCASRL